MQAVIHPVNAPSPEFVPVETLAKAPGGWNGRPVVTDHPFVGNQAVSANDPRILETMAFGLLFNTASPERVAETGRLEFEAWLDPAKAESVGDLGKDVIRRLEAGEPIEVSVGAIVIIEDETGNFDGKDYRGRWVEIVPDHLAMLPDGAEGACSNKMGCGARAARHRVLTTATGGTLELLPDAAPTTPTTTRIESMAKTATPAGSNRRLSLRDRINAFMTRLTAAAGMTDNELHREISDALRMVEPGYLGIDDVDQGESMVYYACAPGDRWQTFRRSFTEVNGEVTLGADRTEVEPVTRYEPVVETAAASVAAAAPASPAAATAPAAQPTAAPAAVVPPASTEPAPPSPVAAEAGPCKCQTHSALSAQGVAMHKNAERIKALIANPANAWTEADQPFLEALADERLAQFEAPVTAAQAAPVAAPVVPVVPAPAVAAAAAAPAQLSEDEYLATAPQTIRDIVKAAKAADVAKRTSLLASLKANQDEFTEAELVAMSTEQLERFNRLCGAVAESDEEIEAAPAIDYSARTPRAAASKNTNPPDGYAVALAARKEAK